MNLFQKYFIKNKSVSKTIFFICILFLKIQISVAQISNFETSQTEYCAGDTIKFTNNSSDFVTCKWDFGDGYESYFTNSNHIYNQSGDYTVILTVFSESGSSDTSSYTITIFSKPELILSVSDTTINDGNSINVTATGNFNEILWSNGSEENSVYFSYAGTFFVTVTEYLHGCKNTDSVKISIINTENILSGFEIMNNILTPNNDGINDFLSIKNIEYYNENIELLIYNSRGNLIYDDKNYKNTWNGIDNKGNIIPAGTYYYIIKSPSKNKTSGYIDVIIK